MSRVTLSVLALSVLLLFPGELSAQGFRGGGGGGGRGAVRSPGGGGGGASVSRPAARPSVPNLGASRPTAPSRPNISAPNISRPAAKPAAPSLPQVNRPSGGLKPSARPALPSSRPSIPSTKPATRPQLPSTRPSLPSTRPGVNLPGGGSGGLNNLPNRPSVPSTRPSIPNLGGGSGNRPNISLPNRPDGGRPNVTLPGSGGNRPSVGDIGDFLGMDKPLRPETLPGIVRPGGGGNRPGDGGLPGLSNRPGNGNRPGDRFPNLPGGSDRPKFPNIGLGDNRPINIGQINIGNNTVISNRPSWTNIDRNRVTNINNRWQNQIGGMHNWQGVHPNRAAFWAGWGVGVRSSFRWHHHNPGCFRGNWWYGHPCRWGGWNYGYGFVNRPWRYWWTVPTYAACVNWFTWQAPPTVWAQPVYYDYGQGGNVVYNDNSVYINGDQVATSTEFAQSAADLATVPAPASEEDAKKAEWLALGTFTVSAGEKDVDPTRIVQLAVSKEGIVSGTLYNTQTDETQTIQGQVDKETQRVAMRMGESEDIVVETGLYNLTQAEAPMLVHFGPDKVENWLLVRLDDPAPDDVADAPQPQ